MVVVGARCAGSSVAAMLAAAGRRVVVLDRASFPADTLSTHAMFPTGCAEFQRIGASGRGSWPSWTRRGSTHVQVTVDGPGRAARALGARRRDRLRGLAPAQPARRAAGRERARAGRRRARALLGRARSLWERGRVAGVAYPTRPARRRRIRADVVVGADGRRSTVAAQVGAWHPYRVSKNGRGLVFRYMDDPAHEAWHRRRCGSGATATRSPSPSRPRTAASLTLFMGDAAEVADARKDPEGYWQRSWPSTPGCAERVAGATEPDQDALDRTTRRPSGARRAVPGWALAGDASHFKDPVTGQGMGDALWMGRTLGESARAGARRPGGGRPRRCGAGSRPRSTTACTPTTSPTSTRSCGRCRRCSPRWCASSAAARTTSRIGHVFGRTRTTQQVVTAAGRCPRAGGRALRARAGPRPGSCARRSPTPRPRCASGASSPKRVPPARPGRAAPTTPAGRWWDPPGPRRQAGPASAAAAGDGSPRRRERGRR